MTCPFSTAQCGTRRKQTLSTDYQLVEISTTPGTDYFTV